MGCKHANPLLQSHWQCIVRTCACCPWPFSRHPCPECLGPQGRTSPQLPAAPLAGPHARRQQRHCASSEVSPLACTGSISHLGCQTLADMAANVVETMTGRHWCSHFMQFILIHTGPMAAVQGRSHASQGPKESTTAYAGHCTLRHLRALHARASHGRSSNLTYISLKA